MSTAARQDGCGDVEDERSHPGDEPGWATVFWARDGAVGLLALRWATTLLGGTGCGIWIFLRAPEPRHTDSALLVHVCLAVVAGVLPALVVVDLVVQRLPSAIIISAGGAVAGVALIGLLAGRIAPSTVLLGAGCALAAFTWMGTIWFLAPPGALGFGDVRLAALSAGTLGLSGPDGVWLALAAVVLAPPVFAVLHVATAALVSHLLSLRHTGAAERKSLAGIPYGPALAAGYLVSATAPQAVLVLIR